MQPAEEVAVLESIGGSATDRDAFYTMMEQAMAKAPAAMRAEGEVTLSIFRQDVAARKLPSPLDVPTTVILAGRTASLPQAAVKFDTKKYAELTQQGRVERLRGWVRRGGEFHVATAAGHNVHLDAPDLVIEAIRRLVQAR
jgi:pimeloyl-ACP methyl ester carboxylesterase